MISADGLPDCLAEDGRRQINRHGWPVVQDRGTCRVYCHPRYHCVPVHLLCRLGAAVPDGTLQRHLSIMSPTSIRTVLATLWITTSAGGLFLVACAASQPWLLQLWAMQVSPRLHLCLCLPTRALAMLRPTAATAASTRLAAHGEGLVNPADVGWQFGDLHALTCLMLWPC